MSDLKQRLHKLDLAEAPDVWVDASTRIVQRSPELDDQDLVHPLSRIVTVVVSLAISLVAIGLLVVAFAPNPHPGPNNPASPPTNGPVIDTAIPDGAIVFSSSTAEGTQTNLYFVSPEGGPASAITGVPADVSVDEVAWAPDGMHLAFVMGPAQHLHAYAGDANLYVLDLSTGSLVRLTKGLEVASPSWSPDGRQIVFVAGQGTTLEVINADGTGRHTVADARGYYQRPSWSPDGSVIAFQSSPDRTSEQTAVFTIRPDGTGERQLTPGTASEGFPSWSPDGTRIVYSAAERLWIMNGDGSHERALAEECHLPCVADFSPKWSPDGKRIVFVRQEDGGAATRLYTVDLSSGEINALTPNLDWVGAAAWRSVPS
ncbi:MAG: LpqB family beta-propeller domain-containing protein [Actinomycetota bacterium]|nr:LpqB family beta-propeller domain-containing protein [Actinomycetota bacterium]MDH5313673.1 LpqB family beta-propeller domain-containing protein [Actinomycetota bacterium]